MSKQQTQNTTPTFADNVLLSQATWWQKKCRSLVFSALADLKQAHLIVEESGQIFDFGNKHSSLIASMKIHDMSVYSDFVRGGSVAASEAYLAEKWSSPNLTQLIRVFARCQDTLDDIEKNNSWSSQIKHKLLHLQNLNSQTGSKKNILAHYDLGNDLYQRFLDESMMYSCAIYSDEHQSLSEAQQNKLHTICEKLDLKPTDHLLEIGTGWGALAIYAAKHYGCQVTTTTISDAQFEYAEAKIAAQGLSNQITLLKKDYRLLTGEYDKLVSIEMIEAVGHKFMADFFQQCNARLKPDGKLLIQAITIADQRYDEYRQNIDFIQKYIFPGGCLPSLSIMSQHIASSTNMMIDHVEDIGLHYARTLHDWRDNFDANWEQISQFGFDNAFKRLWHYYLGYCEGAFIERVISTHHIVARKPRYRDNHDDAILDY